MSFQSENVTKLVEITGLDQAAVESLLAMNNFNLEQAINYHLETLKDYETQVRSAAAGCSTNNLSPTESVGIGNAAESADPAEMDYVRAPIPSRREQLVMPEDDNFRFRKRRAPVFSVCPFRNFAREAEIQEEQLNNYLDSGLNAGDTFAGHNDDGPNLRYGQNTYGGNSADGQSLMKKRARLEDLFRPPVDLLFWGTFRAVRDYATLRNRWLIVNLQDNAEFKSQIINRDIWSDPVLKELVQKYFVLWQVSVDNPEGLRFKSFYKAETVPYVCLIDPRTGEEKQAFDVVTAQTFIADLNEFLKTNSYSLDEANSERDSSTSSSRSMPTATVTRPPASGCCASNPSSSSATASTALSALQVTENSNKPVSATELSEEDQLALAIKNSLRESREDVAANAENDETDDVIVLSDSDEEIDSYENYLGNKGDPLTVIQLRLPDGEKTQFEWPSTTKLRAIKLYVQSKYPDDTKEPYKVISAFPRQNILELDENSTLVDAKLHPRAILHLHPDN